jgi:hypothetical protein
MELKYNNKLFNFQLKKIEKNVPLIDYNKLNDYGIWKNNKFLFKKGFGNDTSIVKNTKNKIPNQIQLERNLYIKSIINNYQRYFNKKLIDTTPPKSLFNPPIYYNYLNSSRLSKLDKCKLKNYGEEKRIKKFRNNKEDNFDDNGLLNEFKKEDILEHLNESYLFFKKKKNQSINPLIKIFNKDITIKKRELNSLFNQRINMIKNNSMRELKTKKLNI